MLFCINFPCSWNNKNSAFTCFFQKPYNNSVNFFWKREMEQKKEPERRQLSFLLIWRGVLKCSGKTIGVVVVVVVKSAWVWRTVRFDLNIQQLLQWVSRIWASLTWFRFEFHRHEQILSTVPAPQKNDALFKSGQNRLKNNHFDSLI